MKKLYFHKLHVLMGLSAILVMVISPFARLGIVHASPVLISDPPANQVAVKLKPWVSINTILARYNATQIDMVSETNLYMLQLPGGQTADQMLPTLNADTDLWYAEPNYYTDTAPDGTRNIISGTRAIISGTGGLTPTPINGGDQWAWQKINRTDAQKISTGKGVIVAVLDTGLAGDHALLSSNIYMGYDFVRMASSFLDAGNGLDDNGDGTVDEFVGHGTHVAGIILSTTTPTGVTDPLDVRIMPVRVLNSDGMGTYADLAKGIHYAVDNGADVINMSLTAPRLTPSLSEALAYAASHGVIVVAAAGNNDPGPNYPAHYSDRLAVIAVGATDRNDAIASFSGGLASDVDVFAPGVDIYSSYPYPANSYALGTGTSMAAPIVSGEAAMLISKHRDWSAAEVAQQIISKGATVSGSSAKRIDLTAALTTGVEVDHFPYAPYDAVTDGSILPRIRLMNNTSLSIPLSELKLRYWYTIDTLASQTFQCDYTSTFGCPNPTNMIGTFTTLASNSPNKTSLSDTYIETGFSASAGNLGAGGEFDTYLRIAKDNPNIYIKTNDYSFDPSRPDLARWERITVYRNGTLVWGIEPTSSTILTSTPTRTPTLYVPTATYTKTATSAAAVTATFTKSKTPTAAPSVAKTSTPAVATSTSTKTSTPASSATKSATIAASATRTNTPVPPTATSTGGGLKVQLEKDPSGNDGNTGAGFYTIISNTGTTAVSNVTMRFYFTPEGGTYTANQYILEKYYDQCGGSVQGPTLLSGTTYYFTLNCAGASLASGASWQMSFGLHLSDWSNNFNGTNDWWHTTGALPTTFADWIYVPAYVNNSRVWGVEPP